MGIRLHTPSCWCSYPPYPIRAVCLPVPGSANTKLSPRISPKKSVEGLVGSMLFAMAGAFAVFACTYDASKWATRWWVPIVAGILIGAVGTFGDLCASMLKRDIGIKDMGHLLKGHGGVMDRVDSILMSAPFTCALLWITGL